MSAPAEAPVASWTELAGNLHRSRQRWEHWEGDVRWPAILEVRVWKKRSRWLWTTEVLWDRGEILLGSGDASSLAQAQQLALEVVR